MIGLKVQLNSHKNHSAKTLCPYDQTFGKVTKLSMSSMFVAAIRNAVWPKIILYLMFGHI